jgi:hypothetical protein
LVVFEQVGVGGGVEQVVDRHDFQLGRMLLEGSLQDLTADSAEAVDPNAGGHGRSCLHPAVSDLAKRRRPRG